MPDFLESPEEALLAASAAEDDRYAELLLAGFQACAKEALRFLLEDEGLPPDHPLPAGLNEHLVRQQCHLAGSLQNDSGVDLEESFLNFPTDGDTTTEGLQDKIELEDLSNDLLVCPLDSLSEETVQMIQMNPHVNESESVDRTERLTTDRS